MLAAEETIKVPQMAESISEGTLKTWLKKEGDMVQADEEIASIETDKVRLLATPFWCCGSPWAEERHLPA